MIERIQDELHAALRAGDRARSMRCGCCSRRCRGPRRTARRSVTDAERGRAAAGAQAAGRGRRGLPRGGQRRPGRRARRPRWPSSTSSCRRRWTHELAALVDAAIAETGATGMRDMGKVMGPVTQRAGRPRRRQGCFGARARPRWRARAPRRRGSRLRAMARLKLSVGNELAAELGGDRDAMLLALQSDPAPGVPARQRADPGRRRRRRREARLVVDELSELVAEGVSVGPQTVDAVAGVLSAGRPRGRHAARRRVAAPRQDGIAQDGRSEALRRRHPRQHRHLRDRAGRHRQDLPGDRAGGGRAAGARGRPDHPHPAGGRGGRAAGLPARRPAGQGRPLPAAAVRRPARHARRRSAGDATWTRAWSRSRRSRSCAAAR